MKKLFLLPNLQFLTQSDRHKNLLSTEEISIIEQLPDEDLSIHPELLHSLSLKTGLSLDLLFYGDLRATFKKSSEKIRMVIIDIDGVMTDGGMYYTEFGDEFKKFNTKDGMAIKRHGKAGLEFGILSNGILKGLIESRASLLGIKKVYVGKKEKLPILEKWLAKMKIEYNQVAYLGDDINDLAVMEKCGLTACPADASLPILNAADIVLQKKGGEGCVREFLDTYIGESHRL